MSLELAKADAWCSALQAVMGVPEIISHYRRIGCLDTLEAILSGDRRGDPLGSHQVIKQAADAAGVLIKEPTPPEYNDDVATDQDLLEQLRGSTEQIRSECRRLICGMTEDASADSLERWLADKLFAEIFEAYIPLSWTQK